MLTVLNVIIYALVVLIAIILVALILIQPSKGGGLGSAFGGVGENVFGAGAMEHLSKLTIWLISIFFVLALLLTILPRLNKNDYKSVTEEGNAKTENTAPAETPAATVTPATVSADTAKVTEEVKAAPAKVSADTAKVTEEVKAAPAETKKVAPAATEQAVKDNVKSQVKDTTSAVPQKKIQETTGK